MSRHHSEPDNGSIDVILRDKMEEIIELIEAIANGEPDTDIKLAELLEGEAEAVRIAIVDKLRDMIKERAAEKEQMLDQHLEAQKRLEVTRQRNIFVQWLSWLMSEETLRKIREVFTMRPGIEAQVKNIGEELAAKGVLTQMQIADKRDLGELHAGIAKQQGQGRDTGKGR